MSWGAFPLDNCYACASFDFVMCACTAGECRLLYGYTNHRREKVWHAGIDAAQVPATACLPLKPAALPLVLFAQSFRPVPLRTTH